MQACTLLSLPNELLREILLLLPPIHIVKYRAVCTRIRDNIDGCSEAQRLIELAIEGYQPNRRYKGAWTEEIHKRFGEFRRALLTFKPASTANYELITQSTDYDAGLQGAYVAPIPSTCTPGSIIFVDMDPQNVSSSTAKTVWEEKYQYADGIFLGYGLSRHEGLIIVVYLVKTVELSNSQQEVTLSVHLKAFSPSSDKIHVHPRAGHERVNVKLVTKPLKDPCRAMVEIWEDHTVIRLELETTSERMLLVLCWVSGETILASDGYLVHIEAQSMQVRDRVYGARFLGPKRILISSQSSNRQRASLSLICLRDAVEEYSFELPFSAEELQEFHVNVTPTVQYNEASDGPFALQSNAWEVDPALNICVLEIEAGFLYSSDMAFSVVIMIKSLEAFADDANNEQKQHGYIPWEDWGPQSTRWFPIHPSQTESLVNGSLMYTALPRLWINNSAQDQFPVESNDTTPWEQLYSVIFDFNPRNIDRIANSDLHQKPTSIVRDAWTYTHRLLTCPIHK
ncbi:hypothetical protein M408DRAFT_25443 [Serendipita vermifera MAFF 305830]|uniref:F-box domain-containing protein n=1 Tax=Serendipita vermifera MAFF 305830 TaxID=933852 RepID=A0A0C3B2S3_SERVB|nr:hypothetical protein M408DRAFT_25443 [Serendipita vermifera MAFF 305830]